MEFCLIAPVVAGMIVVAVDLGVALGNKMTIDQIVSGGASFAATDPGSVHLKNALAAIAGDEWDVDGGNGLKIDVSRYCECLNGASGRVRTETNCGFDCAGQGQPAIYYILEAEFWNEGMFLPGYELSSLLRVDVQ